MKKPTDVSGARIAANAHTHIWNNSLDGLANARLGKVINALGQIGAEGKVSLSFKIRGATAKTGPSLCLSCCHGKVVKGQNCEEIVFCSSYEVFGNTISGGPSIVPFRVAECGGYTPANTPNLDDMKKIAWDVTARKRGSVGFEGGTTNPDEMVTEITPPPKRKGGSVLDE